MLHELQVKPKTFFFKIMYIKVCYHTYKLEEEYERFSISFIFSL